MNTNVEQGILDWLVTELAAADVENGEKQNKITVKAATVATKTVQLLALTSNAPVVESWPAIVVRCLDAHTEVADASTALWLGTVEIAVMTPRHATAYTEANHRAIADAVRALLNGATAAADIGTALASYGIAGCDKWFFAGAPDAHTDGRWITVLRLDPFAWRVSLA